MRFTDEQKEMLALLPNEVKDIKTLRDASKLLLSYIIELYGMDFAKNNGYVFKTNKEIMAQTGIKQKRTLIDAARELELKGYITRTAGQRVKGEKNKASEYRLCGEMLQYALPNAPSNTPSNTPLNTPSQYKALLLKINELEERIKILELQNIVSNTPNPNTPSQNMKYTSDIDKEIESETNDNNDNTEEYNIKDQNEKEIITEDNLEILKENEILNDEIPSDLPPLDIDSFVSTDNEISNNENISDSDSSKNELEFSIFGNDIISEDENDNDTTVKFINGKFTVVSETEDEINSSSDVEQDNDNNSNEISNSTMTMEDNTISNNTISISSDEFQIWGKIQPIFEKTSNKLVEYLFSEYQTIHSQKEIQGTFAQVKRYISLDKEQLNNVSIPSTGTFGILSLKNETYNFIQCNTDPNGKNDNFKRSLNVEKKGGAAVETEKASNNADTAVKMSQVDNYTTDNKKVAPVQPQTANNESVDMCYTMYGVTADEMNDILSHHGNYNTKPSKGAWRQMTIHLHGEQTTVSEALNHFKDKKKDGKEYMECNTFLYYFTPICNEVEKLLKTKTMTDEQYQDFLSIIGKLTRGKFAYWRKVFSNREPRPNFPSEQEMWKLLVCPQINNTVDNKTNNVVDNNKTYEDNVILPTHKDFESMNLDEIKNHLLTFVQEHPNLSDDKKKYINDLCIAYTLDPQYVA